MDIRDIPEQLIFSEDWFKEPDISSLELKTPTEEELVELLEEWWKKRYEGVDKEYREFDKYSGHYLLNDAIKKLVRHFYEIGREDGYTFGRKIGEITMKKFLSRPKEANNGSKS